MTLITLTLSLPLLLACIGWRLHVALNWATDSAVRAAAQTITSRVRLGAPNGQLDAEYAALARCSATAHALQLLGPVRCALLRLWLLRLRLRPWIGAYVESRVHTLKQDRLESSHVAWDPQHRTLAAVCSAVTQLQEQLRPARAPFVDRATNTQCAN